MQSSLIKSLQVLLCPSRLPVEVYHVFSAGSVRAVKRIQTYTTEFYFFSIYVELEVRTKCTPANVTSSVWNPLTLNQRSISVDS